MAILSPPAPRAPPTARPPKPRTTRPRPPGISEVAVAARMFITNIRVNRKQVSPPSNNTRNIRGVTSASSAFWIGIGNPMEESVATKRQSASGMSFTRRNAAIEAAASHPYFTPCHQNIDRIRRKPPSDIENIAKVSPRADIKHSTRK
ncbi:hypothetical protein EVAR_23662_1 [Eumeta japonica]|uniref:Uncharacterized protein n=1 Tax=Eumeta variegata TaxID=151549 RepID=A0A4C1VHM9_EUMVA|nr:hypothetical protein EVAR_23662_1 [Eumeta japonica]